MAEISRLPARNETPIARARRLDAEARALSAEVAGMLSRDVSALAGRCAEMADLAPLPAGLRDAFLKLGRELESRGETIQALMSRAPR